MSARPTLSAVVPTLGRSELLSRCLARLRRDGGAELEIVLVSQGAERPEPAAPNADQVVRLSGNLGFSGGANAGIGASSGELVALVNDDALIEPGWFESLIAALEGRPEAAGAQGANLRLDSPEVLDGCGIAWNAFWRPVQIGRGMRLPLPPGGDREVFGVSGTASLFRREALEAAALPGGSVFDERLGSFYEDVELAVRLRRQGRSGLFAPEARALHAGSTTARQFPAEHGRLLTGNRFLALRRLSGPRFGGRAALLAARDAVDLASAVVRLDWMGARGVVAGWRRALRLLPAFAADTPLPVEQIRPFRVARARAWPR